MKSFGGSNDKGVDHRGMFNNIHVLTQCRFYGNRSSTDIRKVKTFLQTIQIELDQSNQQMIGLLCTNVPLSKESMICVRNTGLNMIHMEYNIDKHALNDSELILNDEINADYYESNSIHDTLLKSVTMAPNSNNIMKLYYVMHASGLKVPKLQFLSIQN